MGTRGFKLPGGAKHMAKDVPEIGLPVDPQINGDVHTGQPGRGEEARRL